MRNWFKPKTVPNQKSSRSGGLLSIIILGGGALDAAPL